MYATIPRVTDDTRIIIAMCIDDGVFAALKDSNPVGEHLEVIRHFGRFPHRTSVFGRISAAS
jgi:uncharacterized protein (DUF924 family)